MDILITPSMENLDSNNCAKIMSTESENAEEPLPETDPNGGSANSSTDQMESLFVEEDEDGLGTESLRMSGSDDENGEDISPMRRKKRTTQQIVETDDEDEGTMNSNGLSGNDKTQDDKEHHTNESEKNETEEVAHKPKKFSALIDSDSDPEVTQEEIPEVTTNNDKLRSDDLDTTGDEEATKEPKKMKKKKKSKKLEKSKKKDSPTVTSDSEDDEVSSQTEAQRKKSKVSDLIDSDSDSSNTQNDPEEEDQQQKKPRAKKPQRASAKKAIDEIQAIQSETQRLYRETQVSIPYHKPKRRTLKEFLSRHTVPKPTLEGPEKSLKMSPEELEEYAKHLEERAKEATEFFKSESEDELKDIVEKENIDKEPEAVAMETSSTELNAVEAQPEAPQPLNTEQIDQILKEHEFISQPSTEELLDFELTPHSEPVQDSLPSTSTAYEIPKDPEQQPTASTSKPSSLAELKRRLIAEKHLPVAPTLKGDANMIIDFETGDMFARKPTGVENLFQRFIKSNKNNKKKPEEMTPSQELQSTLKVTVIKDANKEKEPKPGEAYTKLKESLRTLITKKRKEEYQKKIEETKEEEEEYNKCCGLEDEEDEEEESETKSGSNRKHQDIVIDEEENEVALEDDDEGGEEEEEDENNDVEMAENQNKDEEQSEEKDDEENKEDEEAEDDENNESASSSSSEEELENDDPSTRKHRVIKAFEDSDDEEANPGLNATSTSVLFKEEQHKKPEEVESELLDLCSGQFAQTQGAPLISQIPITQTPGNVTETELEDLCSGVFNEKPTQVEKTQVQEAQTKKIPMRIVSSDDEEKDPDEEESKSEGKKVKKLTKKKKKHLKLGFSDDEDEDEDEEEEFQQEEFVEDEEEIPQTFIDYDSEENEIEVQMSKKDCVKQATTFFEKEAELSESEWGSADEDEQNMDKYDKELGDEEEFDQQKLHSELEKIHMIKTLDDDIRQVKKIQDMLFDNEEADGGGRERKFRWKNAENGFSLDDPAGGGDADNKIDSADDEEEMQWRKMRFEREQFLLQKSKEEILAEVSATELGKKLLETMKPKLKNPHYTINEEVIEPKEYKPPSFLIKQNDVSKLRNSILNTCNKEQLAMIAQAITKSGEYESNEGEVIQKAKKNGNFVFVPLTEEEVEMKKRKAEESRQGNVAKKMKTSTKKSLILDKLL